MGPWLRVSLGSFLLVLMTGLAFAGEDRATLSHKICDAAEVQAKANGIDQSFFARLLWRESLFDPNVVSDKGAQGIAQFMPGTAARRGLANPFDPFAAVSASAAYLSDLKKQFGNLGLAAAAYNAGEARVQDWLSGKGGIPDETRAYVTFITGHPVEEWKSANVDFTIPAIGAGTEFSKNCVELALQKTSLSETRVASAPHAPWGAVLAVNFSETRALEQFRRLKLRFPHELANRDPLIVYKRNLSRGRRSMAWVMLGERSAEAAQATCGLLNAVAAPCLVRKN